jgi:hypothetical protein
MPDGVYFSYMPTVPYDTFDGSGEYKVVTDVFRRVRATLEARTDKTIYYNYTVNDGETPETVAYKYYGYARYHWVILLMNQIRSPQWCWPLDNHSFERYISNKYGSMESATSANSHYETKEIRARVSGYGYEVGDVILQSGIVANANFTYTYAGDAFGISDTIKVISKYDKELAENESKRNIILLRRNLLGEFVEEFEKLLIRRR